MQLSLRGIGPWLVTLYLTELGGRDQGNGCVTGEGWRATIEKGEPVTVGSIHLGVTQVAIEGDPAIVDVIMAAFQKKAMRAGG